ncbi:hypothetical protein IQ268_15160 [Oculatella sp. LEGE 06141]|uniref:hypothetical protein n=1 Tax=Oculatella sp. LEGE 06141 TaxID=1828648 RepID=UPI00187DEE71|nr:hypothetical protein [Oculatella sp. LEGE 06141]MBE9179909.1 hypothetical protein [Oculatella sp. LEGE 06141]
MLKNNILPTFPGCASTALLIVSDRRQKNRENWRISRPNQRQDRSQAEANSVCVDSAQINRVDRPFFGCETNRIDDDTF